MINTTYTAEPIKNLDELTDIRIKIDGKTWHLWGRNGLAKETSLANKINANTLPVLIGAGLGHCLELLLNEGFSVAVVDKEQEIERLTVIRRKHATKKNILWIDDSDPQKALDRLAKWQTENGNKPFSPIVLPLYPRLDREYYGPLSKSLKPESQTDFWNQVSYPKFESVKPRVLFFDSNYFLCGEILTSLARLEIEHRVIALDDRETGSQKFIELFLKTILDFKPDFVLTVNHFGLDQKGKLAELLEKLGLPLASWFVDNPHLILHDYAHPGTDNTVIFTFDAGNLDEMKAKGFSNVHYLPLATDPNRFRPRPDRHAPPEWISEVSFVGNSMTTPVTKCLSEAHLPDDLLKEYISVAAEFGESSETSVSKFLEINRPKWFSALKDMTTKGDQLALESLLTWEATRQYRLTCVEQLLKFSPLIVGDSGWSNQLGMTTEWRNLPYLDYYEDLPRFYPLSKINFNCTSRQMIGAVNQRVFDVPACGGFILTDYRKQMEDLFDLDTEAVIFQNTNEIPTLIREYLSDEKQKNSIVAAARKRILAEHTYEIRMQKMLKIMHQTFS